MWVIRTQLDHLVRLPFPLPTIMLQSAAGDTQAGAWRASAFRDSALPSSSNVTGAWRGTRTLGTQGAMYPSDLRMAPSAKPFGSSGASMPYGDGGRVDRHLDSIERNRTRLLTWAADTAEAGRIAIRKENLRRTLTAPPPQPRPPTNKDRANAMSYGMRFGKLG